MTKEDIIELLQNEKFEFNNHFDAILAFHFLSGYCPDAPIRQCVKAVDFLCTHNCFKDN